MLVEVITRVGSQKIFFPLVLHLHLGWRYGDNSSYGSNAWVCCSSGNVLPKGIPPPPQEGMGSNLPSKSESISMCSPRDDHWFDWDLCSLCSAQSSQGKGTPPEKNVFFRALPEWGGGRPLPELQYIYSSLTAEKDVQVARKKGRGGR